MYLLFAGRISDSLRNAVEFCLYTIVPTLFPVMVISTFAGRLDVPGICRRILRIPLRVLFCLSGNSAAVLLFGATGGYTVGIRTAASSSGAGYLSKQEARASALISTSPGIGFSVLTVGISLFGSSSVGWLLFAAVTLGNLFSGAICNHLLMRLHRRNKPEIPDRLPAAPTSKKEIRISDSLIGAVRDSIKAVAGMCGWILLFTVCSSVFTAVFPFPAIRSFLEITDAVRYAYSRQDLPLAAFSLGFGGISVFLQVLSDLQAMDCPAASYFLYRTAGGSVSYLIMQALVNAFPHAVQTARKNGIPFLPRTNSLPLILSLCLMTVVFMASVSEKTRDRPVCR